MNTDKKPHIVHSDSSLSSFITGIVIGAGVALLLGTKEGRTILDNLKNTAKNLKKDLEPTLNQLADKAQDLKTNFSHQASNMTPLPPELQNPNEPTYFQQTTIRTYQTPTQSFTQKGKPLS